MIRVCYNCGYETNSDEMYCLRCNRLLWDLAYEDDIEGGEI